MSENNVVIFPIVRTERSTERRRVELAFEAHELVDAIVTAPAWGAAVGARIERLRYVLRELELEAKKDPT